MIRRAAVLLVATLLAAPAASGAVTDRVQVRATGGNRMAVFAPSLYVRFASPPDYRRGCCYDTNGGQWLGPRYAASGNPTLGGDSTIDWGYVPVFAAGGVEGAARRELIHGGTEQSSGHTTVPHTVAGRPAGRVPAFFVLTRLSAIAGNARHEATIAFALRNGIHAVARFALLNPTSDEVPPFGNNMVNGQLASTWNQEQALQAVLGVALEGNLPPARVTARRTGGRVAGTVRDLHGHPVAGATVRLERRVGRGWRAAGSVRSSATGNYSLAAGRAGTYRAVATLSGAVARSGSVRVG
jgi:Carboxypeptidase regulatory-like domain